MPPAASAVLRWAVNISGWEPEPDEWRFLLQLLPAEERADVERFKFDKDKQRALVSRLLQRKCVAEVLGIKPEDAVIRRTKGRKPFAAGGLPRPHAPNFNFNVSHEGDYVVLASEGHCLCGVDVAAPQQLRRGPQQPVLDYLQSFRKQFTAHEWNVILGASPGDSEIEDAFRRNWSLKEAFVKLRGDGMAYDLSQVEFRCPGGPLSDRADVYLDGQRQHRWRCSLQALGRGHWVSVARGPPDAIVDALGEFTATLEMPEMPDANLQKHLEAPEPPFSLIGICDLVPDDKRHLFEEAGGDAA